jgi:hypothetical protein
VSADINLIEGQWVRDLRILSHDRLGTVGVVAEYSGWITVRWADRADGEYDEKITNLTLVAATRGPVGEIEELEFPPPQCPYCDVDLDSNDGWECGECGATWSYNGHAGTRYCIEKDCWREANLLDADGKPRCDECAVARRAELLEEHEYADLVNGDVYCTSCSPVSENVAWPCPPLLGVGVTPDEAKQIVEKDRAERAAEEALWAAGDRFNEANPVGTQVRYWTGERKGDGVLSVTRTPAQIAYSGTPVVWVEGHGACIALTHVQVVGKAVTS